MPNLPDNHFATIELLLTESFLKNPALAEPAARMFAYLIDRIASNPPAAAGLLHFAFEIAFQHSQPYYESLDVYKAYLRSEVEKDDDPATKLAVYVLRLSSE